MNENIYYNMKPIIEGFKVVWVADNCGCGSNKIEKLGEGQFKCLGCGKIYTK